VGPNIVTTRSLTSEWIHDLLLEMTLEEKVAQMTQAEVDSITPEEVASHGIGSVLSGGGGNPDPNTPSDWRTMVTRFTDAASKSRLRIPLLYGVDAVHGHSNVVGATIFPHNIGLGAAGDPELVEQVYRATGLETAATGVRWDFAPTVAVALDPRWGRTYESFGDDPAQVSVLSAAAVRGLQAAGVVACAKHFVGDGGTTWKSVERIDWNDWWSGWGPGWQIDQGDARIDESTLRSVHLSPYAATIDAGVMTVMASYSMWNGDRLHGHRYLLTDVLKGELGFDGFVVSDWMGVEQLASDPARSVVTAINAGIDMVMVPIEWRRFMGDLIRAVEAGDVSQERIDDAVARILTVKHAIGLFAEPEDPTIDVVGSHRELGRTAAAASVVLLENADDTLPITASEVLVAGAGADDIGLQCGGWTIEWQGSDGRITEGTTILEGLREAAPDTEFVYSTDAAFGAGVTAPLGLVVLAERPHAEGMGDREDLRLPPDQAELVAAVRARVERLAVIVVSARPMVLDGIEADAIVAAWLPGTEGHGVADVLVGARPFTGRLSRDWPASHEQVMDPGGSHEPAWPRGHGLR
jgi:beta-glucosidase